MIQVSHTRCDIPFVTADPLNLFYLSSPGPDSVDAGSVIVTDTTNDSILITWNQPDAGHVDNYNVQFNCTSPNDGSEIKIIVDDVNESTTALASGLDPGTRCIVDLTTRLDVLVGNTTSLLLTNTSDEEGKFRYCNNDNFKVTLYFFPDIFHYNM